MSWSRSGGKLGPLYPIEPGGANRSAMPASPPGPGSFMRTTSLEASLSRPRADRCELGMDVAASTAHVPTELPRHMSSRERKSAAALENPTPGGHLPASDWSDMLKEFRNHLAIVVARSSELSTVLPGAALARAGDCLVDIETSAARMEAMLAWMDAGISAPVPRIHELVEAPPRVTSRDSVLDSALDPD